jgi:hypothetical protein
LIPPPLQELSFFYQVLILNSPLPGLAVSMPRFLDSAAPLGIGLFLFSPYYKLATSGPGRLQA